MVAVIAVEETKDIVPCPETIVPKYELPEIVRLVLETLVAVIEVKLGVSGNWKLTPAVDVVMAKTEPAEVVEKTKVVVASPLIVEVTKDEPPSDVQEILPVADA